MYVCYVCECVLRYGTCSVSVCVCVCVCVCLKYIQIRLEVDEAWIR